MIDALLIAGGTVEQLAAMVKADLADQEKRIQSKRANNAERQRRFRERHGNENNDSNALLTVTECDSVTPPALPLPPNENNSNPPAPTHPDNTPRARKADAFPCPPGVDPIDWDALKANRKAKRAALSEGAHRALVRKLDGWAQAGWPPGPIVAASAERGWTTVFETDEMKETNHGRSQANRTGNPHANAQRDGFSRTLDTVIHDSRNGAAARSPGQPDDASATRLLPFRPPASASG